MRKEVKYYEKVKPTLFEVKAHLTSQFSEDDTNRSLDTVVGFLGGVIRANSANNGFHGEKEGDDYFYICTRFVCRTVPYISKEEFTARSKELPSFLSARTLHSFVHKNEYVINNRINGVDPNLVSELTLLCLNKVGDIIDDLYPEEKAKYDAIEKEAALREQYKILDTASSSKQEHTSWTELAQKPASAIEKFE